MTQVTKLALAAVIAGLAVNAAAYEQGDWILRSGAVTVAPNEDSDNIVLPTAPPTVLPGVSVGNDTQLSLIPVYMLTDNWAVEVLAATPFEHDITVNGVGINFYPFLSPTYLVMHAVIHDSRICRFMLRVSAVSVAGRQV